MTTFDLGQESLLEEQYNADLELLDRYTGFSSELVRLASLGLGGLALFLKSSLIDKPATDLRMGWFNLLLGGAALLFGVAVACGLLHRYYAADGLACHIRMLRLAKRGSTGVEAEVVARTNRYKLATSWLISSECAVAAGAFVAGVAFAVRFSVLGIKWIPALILAGVAVVGAIGLAGRRWWRTWRGGKAARSEAQNANGLQVPGSGALETPDWPHSVWMRYLDVVGKIVSLLSGLILVLFVALLLAGRVTIGAIDIKNAFTLFSVTLIGGLISIGGVKIFSFSASLRRAKDRVEHLLGSGAGCPFVAVIDERARREYQILSATQIGDGRFCYRCMLVDHNGRTECHVSPLYHDS